MCGSRPYDGEVTQNYEQNTNISIRRLITLQASWTLSDPPCQYHATKPEDLSNGAEGEGSELIPGSPAGGIP